MCAVRSHTRQGIPGLNKEQFEPLLRAIQLYRVSRKSASLP